MFPEGMSRDPEIALFSHKYHPTKPGSFKEAVLFSKKKIMFVNQIHEIANPETQ